MKKAHARPTKDGERTKALRLRALRDSVRGIGKQSLLGMLDAGAALEEAAGLLKGHYSAWVLSECRIDARTALGYRKTFRVLNDRRDWLARIGVAPSVAVTIACARPEGRYRALRALESGRALTVADAKSIVRVDRPASTGPSPARTALAKTLRNFSAAFLDEVDRIAAMARSPDADEFARMELAVRARVLEPSLVAIASRPVGGEDPVPNPVTDALTELANAATHEAIVAAASRLVAATEGTAGDGSKAPGNARDDVPVPSSTHSAGIRSTASTFAHGLTAIEICAGGGGQAAGLAKAGFRHVALVERDAFACETLRAAFGADHVVERDLVGYEPAELGRVDLLAGGVPCQPYSQSGERRGAEDERDLFPEALRLVESLRPRAVMLENVMGLLDPGNDTHRFAILAKLGRLGYVAEWRAVDASHFGVPQKRRRAILVAFRERDAMRRFQWPQPLHHYAEEPYPIIAAIDGQLRAREWSPPAELQDKMDRAAPTLTGGSDRKQGIDFGQRKSAMVWSEMGFVQTRIGREPPSRDHEGNVEATVPMLAALQGFPHDWPFRGKRKAVFRQIANAFPPPVAMHLGCAIASALTGEEFDAAEQLAFEGMRSIRVDFGRKTKAQPSACSTVRQQRTSSQALPTALRQLGKRCGRYEEEFPPSLEWCGAEVEVPSIPV